MENKNLEHKRHSLAHLMAAAVMKLYPDAKRAIGPAIDDGFYFDFEFSEPVTEKDLQKIENVMRNILPSWTTFTKEELTAEEAKAEYPDNPYKHELIDEFSEGGTKKLSFYKSGDYRDLCRGGHVENMNEIDPQSFKLDRVAGAYWRGDEKNKMLTRIYALAFDTKDELDAYLKMREEAKARDHKKLGKELGLFVFSELVGAGLPLWTPKGTIIRELLNDYVWSLRKAKGYQKVTIPHITKKDLYETSGHWAKFADELFRITTREGHEFAMKPMNCPHHTQIFDSEQRSYRDMPQRYAETTMVYRDEQSGELQGLSRVRSITQDDAHVFCRANQIEAEMFAVWDIIENFYKTFGFKDLKVRFSRHDPEQFEKYIGDKETWAKAEEQIKAIMEKRGVKDYIDGKGEAAMYGPKIDFIAKDSLGRTLQLATIQLDMNLPERFNLSCINEKGEKERIVMIHAAIMGSIERFMSTLIEHYAGSFPFWLSPVQVKVLPIGEGHQEHAQNVFERLKAADIRAELDRSNESLGKKIRAAKMEKVPYTIIIGDKDIAANVVTLESRDAAEGEKGVQISIEALLERFNEEIAQKK